MAGGLGQWDVQRDEVRGGEQRGQLGVAGGQHAHVEAVGAAGDRLADAPVADDAQRRAVHVGAQEGGGLPREPGAGGDGGGRVGELARGGQQEREGQVGGRLGQHAGGVADRDAASPARLEVDIVGADRHHRHGAQVRWDGVEQVGQQRAHLDAGRSGDVLLRQSIASLGQVFFGGQYAGTQFQPGRHA